MMRFADVPTLLLCLALVCGPASEGFVGQALPQLALVQAPRPVPGSVDLTTGKRLYVAKCQTCHGSKGEGGDARLEKVLGARPPALRANDVQQKSDEELTKAIRTGSGKMKPVEGLTPVQIREIVAYLRMFGKQ